MTRRDDSIRLRHMADHARKAVDLSQGRTRSDLDSDSLYELAMTRLVEVIGEAAMRLSPETRARYPDIPWPEIIAARNRLIHGYDQINKNILWDILQLDLPFLLRRLDEIIAELPGESA